MVPLIAWKLCQEFHCLGINSFNSYYWFKIDQRSLSDYSLFQLTNGTGPTSEGDHNCHNNNDAANAGPNSTSLENGLDHENLEPSSKRRKVSNRESIDSGPGKLLSAELIVYDKHAQCLLTEGEYELILAEMDPERAKIEQKLKNSTWENITIDKSDMVSKLKWENHSGMSELSLNFRSDCQINFNALSWIKTAFWGFWLKHV